MNVLVTGASQGIGAAIARTFAEAGYDVGINCECSGEKAHAVRDECAGKGVKARCFFADVSRRDDCSNMLRDYIAYFGKIDVLVNNAGGAIKVPGGGFEDLPLDYWDAQIQLNLSSTAYCAQPAIQNMIQNKTKGRIINISSIHGNITWVKRKMLPYCAAKSGVNMFTKTLAVEVAKRGITVNAIAPGLINTGILARYTKDQIDAFCRKIPMGFAGEPEDIAETALFLADPKKSRFITGQVFTVDGGQSIDGGIDSMLYEF